MDLADAATRAAQFLKHLDRRTESGTGRLDHYARMARAIAEVPVAAVTFAANGGVAVRGRAGGPESVEFVPEHVAFCTYALRERGTVYIPDLRADLRFSNHPQVQGNPGFGFYAAAPLFVDDGSAIGCLCLLDYRPRELGTTQLRAIRMLGDDLQRHLMAAR